MKQFWSTFFVVLLLTPYCLKVGVWTWYFQNKTYIANELCENRDRPELHCEGSCVLKKALKKADCCSSKVAQSPGKQSGEHPVPPMQKTLDALSLIYTVPTLDWPILPCIFRTMDEHALPTAQSLANLWKKPAVFHPPAC